MINVIQMTNTIRGRTKQLITFFQIVDRFIHVERLTLGVIVRQVIPENPSDRANLSFVVHFEARAIRRDLGALNDAFCN